MRHERKNTMTATVTVGEEAVIRPERSSRVIVAKVIGCDRDDKGRPITVYLDRLIHAPYHTHIGDWRCSGAISTILHADLQ